MNLRPLGPEGFPEWVHSLVASVTSWQPFESSAFPEAASVDSLPINTPNGARGSSFPGPFAADLLRTDRVLLRPEALLSVDDVAELLDVTRQTVHNWIDAGKLRCHRFGNERRVKPKDLDTYCRERAADLAPPGEDWRSVREVAQAARISRSLAYRFVRRGTLAARRFGGAYYVHRKDLDELVRRRGASAKT